MSFLTARFGSLSTRLLRSARRGDLKDVSALLNKGAPINVEDQGKTALHHAVCNRDKALAEFLLAKGANPNGGSFGEPPLHCAVRNGDGSTVELLLAHHAEINRSYWPNGADDHAAALHKAAESGSYEMTELLLMKGADVNQETHRGYTPLYYAEAKGCNDVAELLRRHGGRVPSSIQKLTKPTSPIQIDIRHALARAPAFPAKRANGVPETAYIEVSAPSWSVLSNNPFFGLSNFPNSSGGTCSTSAIESKKALEVLEHALHALNDIDALTTSTVHWYRAEVIDDLETTAVWRKGELTRIWPL